MSLPTESLHLVTLAEYWELPDGRWEVAEGVPHPMPPSDVIHQLLSDNLVEELRSQILKKGAGFVVSATGVEIPGHRLRIRVPDIVISTTPPDRIFTASQPPAIVIEILATHRGNVERTEKLVDYAAAGVPYYWIVDRFERRIEVHRLHAGIYVQQPYTTILTCDLFPTLALAFAAWPQFDSKHNG